MSVRITPNTIGAHNIKIFYKGKRIINVAEITLHGIGMEFAEEGINWQDRLSR